MGKFAIALVIVGGLLAWFGWREYQLASACKPEVNVLTCHQLGVNGPGDNANVEMTDFHFAREYVYSESRGGDRYAAAWIPAMPNDRHSLTVRVIVKVTDMTAADIESLSSQKTLAGLVTSKVESISGKQSTMLKTSYPSLDLDKVQILELNRKPMGTGISMAMMGGGALIMLVPVGVLVKGRQKTAAA